VAFEAELALQCPDDRIDALPQPVREVPGLLLVLAGWADQGQASSLARVGAKLIVRLPSLIAGAWDIRGMQRSRRSMPLASPQVMVLRPT
jgi:hypothetical protein